jgi:hypothetical protein
MNEVPDFLANKSSTEKFRAVFSIRLTAFDWHSDCSAGCFGYSAGSGFASDHSAEWSDWTYFCFGSDSDSDFG